MRNEGEITTNKNNSNSSSSSSAIENIHRNCSVLSCTLILSLGISSLANAMRCSTNRWAK